MVAQQTTGGLICEMDWQDVGRSRSRVRPVSCPVDPMSRYVRPGSAIIARDARVAARLRDLQALLEWAYGFRALKDARQRQTRRAPSAGALYPTETFVVVQAERSWQVLYYHYASRQFHPTHLADADRVAQALTLEPGTEAILFASVLWRSLQRYGVRGYRYCLLDAAHVASNLARSAQAFGHAVALDPWCATAELESLLGLDHGEALLLAARVQPGSRAVPAPPDQAEVIETPVRTTEQPPLFSPVLRRAMAFHRRGLASAGHAMAVAWPDSNDTPDELYRWAGERSSARDFTGAAVTASQYARMAKAAVRAGPILRQQAPTISVYAITPRVQGVPAGLGPLGAEAEGRWTSAGQTPTELANALAEACQSQAIMKSSAFAFVLAAGKSDLAVRGYAGYRPMVLNAGFLCADLYREAARCALGTTSIGGFSDDVICGLLGDNSLTPIVIQAFGVPARSADKVDAARIVWR